MNNEDCWAKPGDTIEIVKTMVSHYMGKRYIVVEQPTGKSSPLGSAWVREDDPLVPDGYFLSQSYKIVKRAKGGGCVSIPDDDIDKSLKRQRDDNLKRAFGF